MNSEDRVIQLAELFLEFLGRRECLRALANSRAKMSKEIVSAEGMLLGGKLKCSLEFDEEHSNTPKPQDARQCSQTRPKPKEKLVLFRCIKEIESDHIGQWISVGEIRLVSDQVIPHKDNWERVDVKALLGEE